MGRTRLVPGVPASAAGFLAFWSFATTQAAALGLSPEHFASMLVGRWPSGAPLMRTPTADAPMLAADNLANNHFLFDDDTRPSNYIPIPG